MTEVYLVYIFLYGPLILFGAIFLFGLLWVFFELLQRLIQMKFKFKFPIIGDFLERGYKMNTDKKLIRIQVQGIIDRAFSQRFEAGEALKVIADFGKLLLKNNDAKFHDVKSLPHSKEKILGALIVEVNKGNIETDIIKEGLVKLSFYQEKIGRKPRSIRLLSMGDAFSSDPVLEKFSNLKNPTNKDINLFVEKIQTITEPNDEDDYLAERNIVEMRSFLNWADKVEQKSEKPSK